MTIILLNCNKKSTIFCKLQTMKKYYIFIFLVFKTILYSQNFVQLKLVKTERIIVDNLLGVDRFDSYYYLNNNAFEKNKLIKFFHIAIFS